MPAALTHSNERLTWKQIAERWPDTWVGLTEIKFKNDDDINVETAVVSEVGSKDDVFASHFARRVDFVRYTSPEKNSLSCLMDGVTMIFEERPEQQGALI